MDSKIKDKQKDKLLQVVIKNVKESEINNDSPVARKKKVHESIETVMQNLLNED